MMSEEIKKEIVAYFREKMGNMGEAGDHLEEAITDLERNILTPALKILLEDHEYWSRIVASDFGFGLSLMSDLEKETEKRIAEKECKRLRKWIDIFSG